MAMSSRSLLLVSDHLVTVFIFCLYDFGVSHAFGVLALYFIHSYTVRGFICICCFFYVTMRVVVLYRLYSSFTLIPMFVYIYKNGIPMLILEAAFVAAVAVLTHKTHEKLSLALSDME